MHINCNGKLIDLQTPKIMGILNVTPDSFFDGGRYDSEEKIVSRVGQMLSDGADFIDIGAYSSRPGADFIPEPEELQRIVPIVRLIVKNFPEALLSVDTFRAGIAKACVENGAAIINDISAGNLDGKMLETVGKLKVPYLMMHMRGNPQTMKNLTGYKDITKEMLFYFSEKIALARSFGINDLIVDPGFGFAKTQAQNYEVLQKLADFQIFGLPVLIGVSRKKMIYGPLGISAGEALNGTTIVNTIALSKGAKILRVHDVKEAVQAVKLSSLAIG